MKITHVQMFAAKLKGFRGRSVELKNHLRNRNEYFECGILKHYDPKL